MRKYFNKGDGNFVFSVFCYMRRSGLTVSEVGSGSSGLGSSPGRGHCVVFLGKTFYSQCLFLHPGV